MWEKEIKRTLGYSDISGVLIQPEVDKIIAEIIEYKNPLRQNIPRKQRGSDSWLLNRRTAAAGNTVAQWISDTAEPDIDRGEYTRVTFQFRTILARGKVTRFAKDSGRSLVDLVAEEIEARARAFKDMEENAMFYGDNNANALQPDGLDTMITGNQRIAGGVTVGGDDISQDGMDTTLDACIGAPDIIATSKNGRRRINSLLQGTQRFVDTTEVKGGFRVMAYDDIPIFASTNVPANFYFDGTQTLGQTGDTTMIFAVDSSEFWVGFLNDVSITPLAKTSSQFDQFDIYADEAFVMRSTIHHAVYEGVNNTTSA
jgi:hypothetical protein